LERILKQAGLTQADLRIEAMGFPELNAALAGQVIDAAIQLEPLVQAAVAQAIAIRWRGLDEIYPYQQIAVLGYGPSLTVDAPGLGNAVMLAYLKGVRDYHRAFTSGSGKPEVAAIIARHSAVKDPAIIETMTPVGLDPNGRINVEGLIEDQQFYLDKGTVSTPVDIRQLVDESYLQSALSELGRY
jgi:NitT/TauT family transport system substrate-binding protein